MDIFTGGIVYNGFKNALMDLFQVVHFYINKTNVKKSCFTLSIRH